MSFRLDIWADGASSPHNKKAPGGWAYAYVINNMLITLIAVQLPQQT